MPVRVLVLGKDSLARAGLFALLEKEPQLSLVAHAPLEDLDAQAAGRPLDAVAIDAGAGLAGLRELDGAPPSLVLVAGEAQASDALSLGARGVLARDADGPQLAAALQALALGLTVLEPSLAARLLRPRVAAGPPAEALTPREAEVLQFLGLGLQNKAIAARLGISDHTAKFHVNSILAKLGAGSRSEAIVKAARAGLVSI